MLHSCNGPHFEDDCVVVYEHNWSGMPICPVCNAERSLVEPVPLANRLRSVAIGLTGEALDALREIIDELEAR